MLASLHTTGSNRGAAHGLQEQVSIGSGASPRARLLAGASALALILAASGPAWAQQTQGGAGGVGWGPYGQFGPGGAGGTGYTGNPGGDGYKWGSYSGGGGGGGAGGGLGGVGGPSLAGANGPAGGVGGANGTVAVSLGVAAPITGSDGAVGGTTGNCFYCGHGGGGGGAGGYGLVLTGGIGWNSSTITGGAGGAGGYAYFGQGGHGGGGGGGVLLTGATPTFTNYPGAFLLGGAGGAAGSVGNVNTPLAQPGRGGAGIEYFGATGATLENYGTITGGAGPGVGGSGAVGSNVTIINAGAISGGAGTASQGKSIEALGGVNRLTSQAGATYSGAIDIGAGASLALTQTTAAGAAAGTWSYNATGNFTGTGALKIATDPGYAVAIGGVNAGFTGTTSVTAGSELILTVSGALASSSVILEAGPSAWAGGQLHLTSNVSFAPTLDMQANSTARLNSGSSLSNVVVTGTGTLFTVGASSFSAISGTGDAVMLGWGNAAAVDRITATGTSDLTGQTIVGDGSLGRSVTLQAGVANAFSAASATTVTAGSVLDLGGFDQTLSSLAGGGTVTNSGASAATLTNQGLSSTFSGVIQNGAAGVSLTQNAAGQTLTLSGANTYSGATTITAGTLRAGAANVVNQTSAVNIDANGVFDLGGFQQAMTTINLNGGALQNGDLASVGIASTGGAISDISGFGTSLTASSGVTTMLGVNSFNASSSVAAGATLRVGSANALSPNSVISLYGVLDLNGFAATTAQVTLTGGTIQGGDLTAVSPTPGILTGVISAGGSISANLVGATRLVAGGGTTVLSGANTYTGVTDIWSGAIVQGASAGAFSASSATNVDGALDLGGFSQTVSQLTGSGEIYNSGAGAATLTNQGASSIFGGVIQDAASATGLTQNSAGNTLTLTGSNTYTGATTISAGVLAGGGTDVFSRASATTVQTGGALDLGGMAQTIDNVTLAGGAIRNGLLNSTGGLNSSGGSIEGLGGATSVTTTGGVTVMLGANVYSGATNINAGVLQVGTNGALSSTSLTTVANGATLDLAGRTATVNQIVLGGGTASITGGTLTAGLSSSGGSVAANLVGSGTLTTTAGVTTLTGAGNAYSGATDIGAGSTLTVTGAGKLSAASATTVAGTLDLGATTQVVNSVTLGGGTISNGQLAAAVTSTGGAISARLTATGALTTMAGVTTLSHAGNDYTGATDIRTGSTLTVTGAGKLSAASATTVAGTLDLGATTQVVNSVTLGGGTISNGELAAAVTSTGGAISARLTATSALTTMAGVTTLSHAGNDYTGATDIRIGSLLAISGAGRLSAFSALSIAGTLDLGGTAQTVNTVTLAGGTIRNGALTAGVSSAGVTIATLLTGASSLTTTAGNTTLTSAGNDYTGATMIQAGSTLTLGAGAALSAASATTVAGALDLGGTSQSVNVVTLQAGAISNGDLTAAVTSWGGSISARLAGASSLTTTGGTTILSNAGNNYTGATNVNGGTLSLAAGGVLSSASLTTIAAGGTLDLGGTTQNVATILLQGGAMSNGALAADVASTGGSISAQLTGAGSLTTTGGTTILSNAGNNYTGATNVNGGALTLAAGGVLSGASLTTIAAGGTLDLGGTTQNVATVLLQGGAMSNGALSAGVTSAGGSISAQLTGAGSLTTTGGTTILSNALNNYTGATNVNGGMLTLAAGGVLSGASLTTIATGGTLDLAGTAQNAVTLRLSGGALQNGVLNNGVTLTSGGGRLTNLATGIILTTTGGTTLLTGTNRFAGIVNGTGAAIVNNGTVFDDLVNAGAYTNNGVQNAVVASNSGTIDNMPGAVWNGHVQGPNTGTISNRLGAIWNGGVNAGANVAGGAIVNLGTWNGPGVNDGGSISNGGVWNGAIDNRSGTFSNAAGSVVTGLVTNAAAATNAGTINGLANVGGSFVNTGIITGAADVAGGAATNAGTIGGLASVGAGGALTTTGALNGGLVNAGAVTASGAISGAIDNRSGGVLTVAGALVGDNASPLTNAAGATLDVRAGFTNLARVDNAGAVAIAAGASLSSATLVQTAGTLTNAGALTATNGVTINGGSLISTGALTGALTNAGTVRAQGRIDGAVANAGAFVTTGALALNGQSFDNRAGGQLSFAAADLTLSGVGAFTNAGLVTLGQYPARAGSTLSAQGFVNTGVVTGVGVIASDVTNQGAIHVGAQNAAVAGYELTVRGALSGTGTVFTAANLGTATANAIRVTGAVAPTMQLDVALARDAGGAANPNNAYFGKLAVARFGGGGFTTTSATQAALANAGAGTFYTYRLGAFTAPDGTSAIGVIQTPNAAAATAATAQTIATISALNASFFANAAAYLGEARGAEPNRWDFNVWNRNAVAETTLSGEGSVTGAAGSAVGSRVNTRLAGFQLGLDAGLFNIQNSGMNAHLGVTAGDVFVSAADRLTPGLSSKTQVPFFGAYGALTGNGFTGIVGVRRDTYQMRLTNGFQGAVDAPLEGRGVTFSGDLQYAMPLGAGFYVQPSAGVYLTKARLDDQVVGHLGTTSFGSVDSVLSRFGLKAGVSRQAGRFQLQMFAAYDVYREWAGNARTTFAPLNAAPGLPALEMSSSRMGGFQQASLGLGWGLPGSGWAGYARADMKFGRQVEGWGLSTGLRYSW